MINLGASFLHCNLSCMERPLFNIQIICVSNIVNLNLSDTSRDLHCLGLSITSLPFLKLLGRRSDLFRIVRIHSRLKTPLSDNERSKIVREDLFIQAWNLKYYTQTYFCAKNGQFRKGFLLFPHLNGNHFTFYTFTLKICFLLFPTVG